MLFIERAFLIFVCLTFSNQTSGWERIVLTLGDRLLQLGHTSAAHVCYLVSFCPFGSHTKPTTRLVLLGCDHRISMNNMLMTPESIRGFERTEALEWARRRGNRKTHLPTLQPFKLRYAELLADFGYEELAREYLLSIRSCIGLDAKSGAAPGGGTASGNFSSALLHGNEFIESLKFLDDRICVSTGAEQSSWDTNKGNTKGRASALGSMFKSVLGKKIEEEKPPSIQPQSEDPVIQQLQDQVDEPVKLLVSEKPQQQNLAPPMMQPPVTDLGASSVSSGRGDASIISSKPSFEQPASDAKVENVPPKSPDLLSNPFSRDKEDQPSMGKSKDGQGPPSSAPPTFSLDASANMDDEPKPKEMILSTPKPAKKDEKKKAPASEPVAPSE